MGINFKIFKISDFYDKFFFYPGKLCCLISAALPSLQFSGASSGIGTEITRVLVLRGAHVIMAVRNVDVGRKVKEAILKEIPNAKIEVMELDLSSMASVRNFASEYNSSDLLLNILM